MTGFCYCGGPAELKQRKEQTTAHASLAAASLLGLLAVAALAAPAQKKPTPPEKTRPTVTATWRIASPATAYEDAKVQRGSKRIRLHEDERCRGRFRIDRLFYDLDGQLLRDGVLVSLKLRVQITKLFSGRGAPPELVISQVAAEDMRLAFRVADVNAWPSRGYVISNSFSPDNMKLPTSWTNVSLNCE